MNRRGGDEHRARLLADARGDIVELGAGAGATFRHYRPGLARSVIAVEPDEALRAHAERAAIEAAVPIRVVDGRAERIPIPSKSADVVVVSLALCSVEDVARTLEEIRRILRPGGEVRFYEHVRSSGHVRGRLEDLVTPLWGRIAGGCHLNRDPVAALGEAGFSLGSVRRFGFAPIPFMPSVTHVLGVATLPLRTE